MSNPGVIILDSIKKNILKRILNRNSFRYFQVEDNIGESIHIHFDDIRIELTIKNFLDLCEGFKEALNKLIDLDNFDVNEIDPLFLKHTSKNLSDLKSIEIININKYQTKFLLNNNILNIYKLKKFYEFTEEDLFKNNNEKRVYKFLNNENKKNEILKKIDMNFKPILDEDLIVRDGKHRLFLKFQKEETAKAYMWKFESNSFKINLLVYILNDVAKLIINKLKFFTKKFLQIFQNFIEKYNPIK
jgi:hypothetical protein